jgi:hypothetical protein
MHHYVWTPLAPLGVPRPQVENLHHVLPVNAGDSTLSLLPPWHIYERSTSYYVLSRAAKQSRACAGGCACACDGWGCSARTLKGRGTFGAASERH